MLSGIDFAGKACLTVAMNITQLLNGYFDGNRAALAKVCNVTRQAVKIWDDDGAELKSEYVIPVCLSLGWRVTPHEIRPDIYPNKRDGLPRKAA
jgi:hypothetical protein